jgi:hypothetical protein
VTDACAVEALKATFEGAFYIGMPIGIVLGMWFMSWLRQGDRRSAQRERAQIRSMVAYQKQFMRRV